MKNLLKIVMLLCTVLIAMLFTACDANEELDDAGIIIEKSSRSTYVIEDADLVLLESPTYDNYRNVGDLYENANDTTEGVFEIQKKSANCPQAEHTFSDVNDNGVRTVSCTGDAKDCWVGVYNYGGRVIENAIFHCL